MYFGAVFLIVSIFCSKKMMRNGTSALASNLIYVSLSMFLELLDVTASDTFSTSSDKFVLKTDVPYTRET